jgi:SprT-like family
MQSPTKQAYDELQQAYDFFNLELFNDKLPHCLITMPKKRNVLGYFAKEQFKNSKGDITDEIAINPMYFSERNIGEVLSTLVHEMIHLWQKHYGKPGRGRYHNKQWADKMESLGLMPSSTGRPGGKRTGDSMSDYIINDGPLHKAQAKLLSQGFKISWTDRYYDIERLFEGEEENYKGKSNREKYTCSECGINAWGKPELSLICGKCNQPLIVN